MTPNTSDPIVTVTLPLRIESLNKTLRTHWAAKSRIRVRSDTWFSLRAAYKKSVPAILPCVVTLTRIAPRKIDDDNNVGGFKSVRDGVADWLLVADNDPRVEWRYAQERGEPKQYACRIDIEPRAA